MPSPKSPVAFSIFGIDIMWYAVFITSAIIISTLILYKRAPKHNIVPDNILNLILVGLPCGIVGARLYYVIFKWDLYKDDILSIFNLRSGGLAIHGGLLLGLFGVWVACKKMKLDFLNVADFAVPVIALSQSIGRFGNYFNQEAHGGPTNLPWGILIDGEKVHPTFLYESLWCFALFWILIYIDNKRIFTGQIFLIYSMAYSLERFCVESLRTDSLMLGPFKQAMILSAFVFTVSLIAYLLMLKRHKKYGQNNGRNL